MNKKNIIYSILTFLLSISVFITPTLGKYVSTHIGVAGILAFTPLIPTGIFVVEPDDFFDDNGNEIINVESESKWGAGDNPGSNPEGEFGLDSLNNVQFTVSNKTNKRLLVSFHIELFYEGWFNWGATIKSTDFSIEIINITKDNASITGAFRYGDSDQQGNIFSKTINPTDIGDTGIFAGVTLATVEDLFVIEPSEYNDYNVVITGSGDLWSDIADIFSTNYYYSFRMVVTEYNPA